MHAQTIRIALGVTLLLCYFGGLGTEAYGGPRRAEIQGDLLADVILGQPAFSEITQNAVVPHKLYLPHGVAVDRISYSQRLYVYDAGNNRILGIDWNRWAVSGSDPIGCHADLVIGQPTMNTSACNGDSGFQDYPRRAPASASTLCLEPEGVIATNEDGSGCSMAVDGLGSLYVVDYFNHRVLKYVDPFGTDRVADDVWGQADFTGNEPNRGLGPASPSANSVYFAWRNGNAGNHWTAGVDVDANGNVWIADSGNHRVLRFPAGSKTADLVLGQSNFISNGFGNAMNRFASPTVVRVSPSGRVYVADQGNRRVLRFAPPFASGMSGTTFGSFSEPTGIDFDPTEPGRVWIMDEPLVELWDEVAQTLVRSIGQEGDFNILGQATGGVGIDRDGNVLVAIGSGEHDNDVLLFRKGAPPAQHTQLFGYGGNLPAVSDLGGHTSGLAVANDQLIVNDSGGRIFFWNGLVSLATGKPADGVIAGVPSVAMKADPVGGHLWIATMNFSLPPRIVGYTLPLRAGAAPIIEIRSPLPVLGGGQIAWTRPFTGLVVTENSGFLWLSDNTNNRVIRVRNPLTAPLVDVVLGQIDLTGDQPNRGGSPGPNTLRRPGALSLDRQGNLYVSDHSLENQGNFRLLVFNRSLFSAAPTQVLFAPSATKIFPDVATWEPTFDSANRMVVGYNPYNPIIPNPAGNGRFPGVYVNPLGTSTAPDAFLKDFHSHGFAAAFDGDDNLYMADLSRSRVLVYWQPLVPDLVADTLASAPAAGAPNALLSVTVTYTARGSTSGGSFPIDLYLSTDTTVTRGDLFLGTFTANASVGTATGSARFPIVPDGPYTLGAILDPGNAVAEGNEGNNITIVLLEVRRALANRYDVNRSGGVDMDDLFLVLGHFGDNPVSGCLHGLPAYDPVYDTNGSGVVDMDDVMDILYAFGQVSGY